MASSQPLVSVIIPCFEQGNFLAEAIESVLAQTYRGHEIVVVDDGSHDNTCEVATGFPRVRYVRQPNRGSASARNLGVRESKGDYLVFLDADDRLLPRALESGIMALAARPECAMTFGSSRRIDHLGALLPSFWRPLAADDYYVTFLRRCYVSHPAAVMCRRNIFDAGVGFDESLAVCSDYDFYLQVARRWQIYCHNEPVSEYRQHAQQKSSNMAQMLEHMIRILRSQEPFTRQSQTYSRMLKKGIRIVRHNYSHALLMRAWKTFLSGRWRDAQRDLIAFLTYAPPLAGWTLSHTLLRPFRHWFKATREPRLPV